LYACQTVVKALKQEKKAKMAQLAKISKTRTVAADGVVVVLDRHGWEDPGVQVGLQPSGNRSGRQYRRRVLVVPNVAWQVHRLFVV
jgi:hypothetical protein